MVKSVRSILNTHQSVFNPPTKLRIFLQISDYNYETDEYCKNKIKIALTYQYSMSFPGKHAEVLYILVSIKHYISNDMDSGHYICDVLYYNKGNWQNFDGDKITKYSGYAKNVYNNLSKDNEQKKGEILL